MDRSPASTFSRLSVHADYIYFFPICFGTTVDVGWCVEGVSVEVEWHGGDTAGVKYVIYNVCHDCTTIHPKYS